MVCLRKQQLGKLIVVSAVIRIVIYQRSNEIYILASSRTSGIYDSLALTITNATITLPKPMVAKRSVSKKWDYRATSVDRLPNSAPTLADFW